MQTEHGREKELQRKLLLLRTCHLKPHAHGMQASAHPERPSRFSPSMVTFVVSLKIKSPVNGQTVKISKIMYIFSRRRNRNVRISAASLSSLSSCYVSDPVSSLPRPCDSPCSRCTGLFAGWSLTTTGPLHLQVLTPGTPFLNISAGRYSPPYAT